MQCRYHHLLFCDYESDSDTLVDGTFDVPLRCSSGRVGAGGEGHFIKSLEAFPLLLLSHFEEIVEYNPKDIIRTLGSSINNFDEISRFQKLIS